eukprot:16091191-Heterocapsa_arctica.AAC.1
MTSTGTVKRFDPTRGFGFVTAANGTDHFLHIKACVDGKVPQQGDTITFDVEQSKLKPGQMQAKVVVVVVVVISSSSSSSNSSSSST